MGKSEAHGVQASEMDQSSLKPRPRLEPRKQAALLTIEEWLHGWARKLHKTQL